MNVKVRIEFHVRNQRYLWAYDMPGVPVWHDGGTSVEATKTRVEAAHPGKKVTYTVSP